MHPLLKRQIRRCEGHGHPGGIRIECLLPAIDEAYQASDEDRKMLQRSMELASKELTERNQELEAALEAASAADQLRRQFINTAAHELGTPLTPLKLQVHTLRRSTKAVDARTVEILERNVDRLIFLVGDLLDSAKIQTGRFHVAHEIIDAGQVVAAAVEGVRPMADEAGIRLRWAEAPQAPVAADAQRLHQVVENLLTNACKFTPAGGSIDVRLVIDEHISICVEDTGMGIQAEALPQLFEPFVQLHDPSVQPVRGSGLGLYICRGIVDAMGGTITGTSRGPGEGALFEVVLPRADELGQASSA